MPLRQNTLASTSGPRFLEAKVFYFANKEMWIESADTADVLMQQCGEQFIDHNELEKDMNDVVWDCVFSHCNDKRILGEAAQWMKRLLDHERRLRRVWTPMPTYSTSLAIIQGGHCAGRRCSCGCAKECCGQWLFWKAGCR